MFLLDLKLPHAIRRFRGENVMEIYMETAMGNSLQTADTMRRYFGTYFICCIMRIICLRPLPDVICFIIWRLFSKLLMS